MITIDSIDKIQTTSRIDNGKLGSVEVTLTTLKGVPNHISIRFPDSIDHGQGCVIDSRPENLISIVESFHEIREEMIKSGIIK